MPKISDVSTRPWAKWLAIIGTVIGTMVAVKQLGFIMPYEAMAQSEADKRYMSKPETRELLKSIDARLSRIEDCLLLGTCGHR
jgi:hypothetical protein